MGELNKRQHEALVDWLIAVEAKETADRQLDQATKAVIGALPPAGLYAFGETVVSISGCNGPDAAKYQPTVHASGVKRCT